MTSSYVKVVTNCRPIYLASYFETYIALLLACNSLSSGISGSRPHQFTSTRLSTSFQETVLLKWTTLLLLVRALLLRKHPYINVITVLLNLWTRQSTPCTKQND